MNVHCFSSPLARDLFALGAQTMIDQGEAMAIDASSGDFVTCAKCRREVRSGSVIVEARRNICPDCNETEN